MKRDALAKIAQAIDRNTAAMEKQNDLLLDISVCLERTRRDANLSRDRMRIYAKGGNSAP